MDTSGLDGKDEYGYRNRILTRLSPSVYHALEPDDSHQSKLDTEGIIEISAAV